MYGHCAASLWLVKPKRKHGFLSKQFNEKGRPNLRQPFHSLVYTWRRYNIWGIYNVVPFMEARIHWDEKMAADLNYLQVLIRTLYIGKIRRKEDAEGYHMALLYKSICKLKRGLALKNSFPVYMTIFKQISMQKKGDPRLCFQGPFHLRKCTSTD